LAICNSCALGGSAAGTPSSCDIVVSCPDVIYGMGQNSMARRAMRP
jgi:hypothetical protein